MIIHLRNTFLALTGRRPAIFAAIFVLGAWMWPITMGHNQSAWAADETIQLLPLLEATESQEAASRDLGAYRYADPKPMPPDLRPLWPIYSFLWAEIYRLRGDTAQARQIYRDLVEWSATKPYEDEWGGSGLAIVALWRCTQLANASPKMTTQEKGILLGKIIKLWKDQTRLGQGMFQTLPYLPALPQLQENLLRQSSSLAWSLNRKEEAQRFFIEYLGVATTGQLTPTEQELLAAATSEGMLSMPKVALFLGKRLDKLGDYQGASFWLNKAIETGKAQVRADASLSLARLERQKEPCLRGKVQKLLDTAVEESTDPNVIQEGLYLKAKIAIREGCRKDYALFQKNLQKILEDFPRGHRADDALFELASYRLDRYRDSNDPAELDAALRLFDQLRQDYPHRKGYIDSSRFKPALALYTRGNPEELRQATTLLQDLEKVRPDGPLHLAALFWLGRIAAESGREQEARTYFTRIIEECPYDYYATRARMHLNVGNMAAKQLVPDAETRKELHFAYARSKDQTLSPEKKSPYHLRLEAAVQSGIYYRALRSYIDFRHKEFPSNRLESIPLDRLDGANRLTHVALLLALRQDAMAAIDTPPTPRNRLIVAETLSNLNAPEWPHGDWPLVIYICGAGDRRYEVKRKIQNEPGYLAIAYPKIFGGLIAKYSGADLPGAFLYAVIRHESAFVTTALSPAGALGLFQFTGGTFDILNKRYHLLRDRKKSSREEFLLNVSDNFYLGSLWFRKELLRTQKNNLLWALMEHNAGFKAVQAWKEKWQDWGRADDYEFMVETVPYAETRTFTRGVINTYSIVEAAEIY